MTDTKKILIADDELPLLNAMTAKLSKAGYQIATARNGEEVIVKVGAEKPNLIVLDIIMPRLNGLDALVKIRAVEGMSKTPVILLSNLSNDPKALAAASSDPNCEYYVKSDIKMNDLIEIINNKLN